MKADLEIARAFYKALQQRDVASLLRILHPKFEGQVTEGLPNGYGGTYHGPQAMLGMWRRLSEAFAVRPEPAESLEAEGNRIVAIGRYGGEAISSHKRVDAVFAHVLRFEDGQLLELRQITDSQRWVEALELRRHDTATRARAGQIAGQ